ncbi:MAG: hypothetical protein RML72_02790 [Bacteroidia bacterium]|nr:hypothetical protein [Bacteroidia bacterium]MDW8157787.1 hypothetical protein [Bacteroidia bacterium]
MNIANPPSRNIVDSIGTCDAILRALQMIENKLHLLFWGVINNTIQQKLPHINLLIDT